jgi:cytochrome c oxidase cbb3-type subunit 1
LIKLHFWGSAYGIGLMVLLLLVGGFVQGVSLNDPTLPFEETTQTVLPYLRGRTLSWILLSISHGIFAFHFGLMLLGFGRTASVPTFLNPLEGKSEGGH